MKKEDDVYLKTEPISRKRMDLLWLDPPRLSQLKDPLSEKKSVNISFQDNFGKEREHEITTEDYQWAKKIERIVDKAHAAGQRNNFSKAVKHYKKALQLAPGCDLFLMSIGAAYVQLGEKAKGIKFLERAAEISPGNARIQMNLEQARKQ